MVDIAFTIREDVTAAMNRMAAAGADMTIAMKDIAGHLADTTRERFETETDPTGRKWTPSRRVIEHGGKTLTLSGDLGNSIAEDWGPDFAAAGPERSGGAGVYALIHQTGGEIRPREKKALSFGGRIVAKVIIPRRSYLGFNDVNADYTIGALARHLGFGAA
ncbi:phage virion morphogenesis protein [Sphingomonas sp. SORGH_AS_0879]|uniref:phage virion morphogenesis protein n=1 Tax=Sphingomonas sp. SORGH_AS_0879 TaxID=3041790 RepID=UPI002788FB85|nr:phage virion morphogenesis protein [Sphingomonas sp. SORGH_AS_0879]MDQ1229277.1 phage virion morphogenesis protein [Sphingomonas sp. SORGH_AS_0879]